MAQLMHLERRRINTVKSLGKACGAVAVLGAEDRQISRPNLIYSFASSFSDGFIGPFK